MSIHYILNSECISNVLPAVRVAVDLLKECHHKEQFFIIFLPHIGFNWHTIVKLIREGNERVIYENNILNISIFNNSKILYIHSVNWVDTVLSIKSMFDNLSVWIDII